jgi:hypothetical protein
MTEPESLEVKIPELEDTARQLGLYLIEAGVLEAEERQIILASFSVGRVAWSDRVQHPERYTTEKELAVMEAGMQKDEFLDVRTQIAERLARGEDPFEDDDE